MFIYQHRIYRHDLQNNPNVIYVFGDNLARKGLGGQAGEMRGEPNAFGFPTKVFPSTTDDSFFSEDNIAHEYIIKDCIKQLKEMSKQGTIIILPSDGLGTGLSEMDKRCPKLLDIIYKELYD